MVFVVVSGLPGAGKSTIGRVLADQLQVPCLDKDDFLDRLLKNSSDPQRERATLSRSADALFAIEQRKAGGRSCTCLLLATSRIVDDIGNADGLAR